MSVKRIDIGSVDRPLRWELARDGRSEIPALLSAAGWKSLDNPFQPANAARELLQSLPEGRPRILLGIGGPALAATLARSGTRPALLVTGLTELADRSEALLRDALGAGPPELTLLVADSAASAWPEIQRWREQNPDAAFVTHPREAAALPALHGALELRLTQPDELAAGSALPKPLKRALLVGSGGLLEAELERALQQRNVSVSRVGSLTGKRIQARQAWELLEAEQPDLVLSTNDQACDSLGLLPEACEQAGIACATWLLDDPRFVGGRERADAAGRGRVAFCWDRNGLDGWAELGLPRSHPLPLATDPALFGQAQGDPQLAGRVVFVGSPRFASAEGYFSAFDGHPAAGRIAERLASETMLRRRPPSSSRVAALLEELGLEEQFDPEQRHRLPAYAVQQANLRYRVQALEALAELRPVVYGSGWEQLLDPARFDLRGPVPYGPQLATIYASDAVHISLTNLQMRAWPNQRAFDVPAAGSAVLLDELEGLDELFGSACEGLVARNLTELAELAGALSADAAARQAAAQAMGELVRQRHTVDHRLATMARVLGLELPASG